MSALTPVVLTRPEWEPLADSHTETVDALTAGHRDRKSRGIKHPVEDFLYDYYGTRPSRLRRWHPGPSVVLEDAPEHAAWTFYREDAGRVSLDLEAFLRARGSAVDHILRLLKATASRPARYGCFGLHEWAMAYRAGDSIRHPLPLRLGQDGTDAVVEANPIACSHFDAFRFFTPEARPLNHLQPTRASQVAMEQPGCLHATMDLYRWTAKLTPAVSSALVLEAFTLALEVRQVDMQASPYDVSSFGLEPIQVETPEGKLEYARRQRDFTTRGADLRARVVDELGRILAAGDPAPGGPREPATRCWNRES